MSDYRSAIEREMDRVQTLPYSLETFQERRLRKERARRLRGAGLALIVGALVVASMIAALQSRRHGLPPASGPITPSNVSKLGLLWSSATGVGGEGAPLVVSGGRLYVVSAGKLTVFPTSCASTAPECSPIWNATLPNTLKPHWWGGPTVADGRVYVGTSDGLVEGFPTSCSGTCSPIWRAATNGSTTTSPPIVVGDVVYVVSDSGHDGLIGRVYAFPTTCSIDPCAPLWTAGLHEQFQGATPAVADGILYVGSKYGTLEGFPLSCRRTQGNCAPVWRTLLSPGQSADAEDGWMITSLLVRDRVLYAASGSRLYAFPTACSRAGERCGPDWIANTPGWIDGNFTIADGYIYVTSSDKVLSVFPTSCGTARAICRPVKQIRASAYWGSLAVADGVAYLGAPTSGIVAFAADCGSGAGACRSLWSGSTLDPVSGAPTVADGTLFAVDDSGRVYAFGLSGTARLTSVGATDAESESSSGSSFWYFALYIALFAALALIGLRALRRRRGAEWASPEGEAQG